MDDAETGSKPIHGVRKPRRSCLWGLLVFAALLSALYGTWKWIIRPARDTGRTVSCVGLRVNLILLALENYHGIHGRYPPAYIADNEGRRMHSWRVLLLPYVGDEDLYKRYDFGEPWNGPNNRRLANEMPLPYRCPASRNPDPTATSYVAVVGPETAWPGSRSVRRQDIKDRSSQTIMIVEVAASDIHWMEPRDMTLAEATRGVNVDRKRGISSDHPGGAHCGLSIISAHFLPDDTPPELIRALLTISGGERVTWDHDARHPLLTSENDGDFGRSQ